MLQISLELNVLFEEPFWVGLFYLTNNDKQYVERIVFGQEPTDGQVYEYFLASYQYLRFQANYKVERKNRPKNPKREQRLIKKQSSNLQSGTKSMQALKLQYEKKKLENQVARRDRLFAKKEYLFKLKQQKRRAKHRGH